MCTNFHRIRRKHSKLVYEYLGTSLTLFILEFWKNCTILKHVHWGDAIKNSQSSNNRFRLHKSQTEQSCALLKEESGQLAHSLRMDLLPADPSHFQHLPRPATHFGLPVTHSLLLSVSTVGEDVNPSSASEATALSVITASVLALQAFDIGSNVSPGRKTGK